MKKIIGITAALFMAVSVLGSAAAGITVHAQNAGGRDILSSGTDYTAILYDSSNGLPTSEANAIVQSEDGFLWFGGYSGLIRYDGTSFYRFDSSTGISSVFSLCVDRENRVWIGTNENGVACYDHGTIRVYGRVEGLKSYSIRSLIEDPEGNILIATTQGLAYVDHGDLEIHLIDDPQVNVEYISKLCMDPEGNIFGLTLNGAVFEVQGLRVTAFYDADRFGEDPVNCIACDPETAGCLYMGTTGSEILTVNAFKDMQIEKRNTTGKQKNINAILAANNRLWIGATNGIGYFEGDAAYQELKDIPMNNTVGNILVDHEGNMWFTSTRQGVLKLVPDRFTDISKAAGLDSVVVNTTCVNRGKLYLGTDRGLYILKDGEYTLLENDLTTMLQGVRIRSIKNDTKNRLWLCTHGDYGLICYDPETEEITCINEEKGLDVPRVRTVTQLSDGSMAAATGNGVYLIKNGEVTGHYGHENGMNNTEILAVEEGPEGRLYLGSDGDGIYVVDRGKVQRISYEDGLTSEVVMRIKWDQANEMFWLITSNSIEYMKDGEIHAVTNFPYSNNYDIIFSDNGDAWILSSNGIYITKTEALIRNENIEYSFYNIKSGLPYIATGNSRSFLDGDGNLYISGTTGVCKVNINEVVDQGSDVQLAIPSVQVDDRTIPVKEGETVFLPAGSRRLVIDAYALTFGLSNPRISYYLEGFDESPVHTTKQEMKPASYTNLDGGKYCFHLNVINDETGEVEKSLSIQIVKEFSAYESIWFWLILVLVVVAGVIFFMLRYFRKRTGELLEKQEKDRLFIAEIMRAFAKCIDMRDSQNRGHSFRVAEYTKLLAEKLAPERGYTREDIEQFYNIALLHDIGKLSIPDKILNKPERLDDEEYQVMKSHAAKGEEILRGVRIVDDLAVGAGSHHERMDGKGYPKGLKGEEIPEVARIIAVADTFDAMYSTRPYRKQLELDTVLQEIKRIRGTQLEEAVVDALILLAEEGALDKAKIEATVEEAPSLEKMPEEEKEKAEDAQAKEDRDFLDSLGLGG